MIPLLTSQHVDVRQFLFIMLFCVSPLFFFHFINLPHEYRLLSLVPLSTRTVHAIGVPTAAYQANVHVCICPYYTQRMPLACPYCSHSVMQACPYVQHLVHVIGVPEVKSTMPINVNHAYSRSAAACGISTLPVSTPHICLLVLTYISVCPPV